MVINVVNKMVNKTVKKILGLTTSTLMVASLFSCGQMPQEEVSNINAYDKEVQLERIKFQAILGIGETVSVAELTEFTNAPMTDYDDVPKGNMRDVLRSMKRGVKGMDVSHYFWTFFKQQEDFALGKDKFSAYLNSSKGIRFLEKFDDFLKTDDDDETIAIIRDSLLESYNCLDVCNLKLIDIITGVKGTEKLTAYVLKIKNDQDFYDNMILNLKRDAESWASQQQN